MWGTNDETRTAYLDTQVRIHSGAGCSSRAGGCILLWHQPPPWFRAPRLFEASCMHSLGMVAKRVALQHCPQARTVRFQTLWDQTVRFTIQRPRSMPLPPCRMSPA